MTALGQLVDDLVFVVERGVAQLSERREEGRIARRLGVYRASTPAGEQQQYKEPLHASPEQGLLHL